MSRHKWQDNEIKYLIEHYSTMDNKEIARHLHTTLPSIHQKAHVLHLKKSIEYLRNNKLEILLDGSNQSAYWIGFLLADGHFHKRGNTVRLDQSIKDVDHLIAFKEYVKHTNPIGYSVKPIMYKQISTMAHITCGNSTIIPLLVKQFQIKSNKTKCPPNIEEVSKMLTDNQLLSLIIGFIDGDGYVMLTPSGTNTPYTRIKINIEIDSSWLDNLIFMKRFLYGKTNKLHRYTTPKINKHGLAHTTIACPIVIDIMYKFIQETSLYVLNRKWQKIKEVNCFNNYPNVPNVKQNYSYIT